MRTELANAVLSSCVAMCVVGASCSGEQIVDRATHDGGGEVLDASDGGDADASSADVWEDVFVDMGLVCERGTYPTAQGDRCSSLAGCSAFTLTRDDLGCVFFPETAGRLTTAECETDADCSDSPYGPNCILRVCHDAEPCQQQEDCEDGLECLKDAICMPPRSPCTTNEDCPSPATCSLFDGLCH